MEIRQCDFITILIACPWVSFIPLSEPHYLIHPAPLNLHMITILCQHHDLNWVVDSTLTQLIGIIYNFHVFTDLMFNI